MGLILFKLGLPLTINANDVQKKFKIHILKNVAKMTIYLPKMGQDATFAQTLNGHNLVIFHPILTFDSTKINSSSRPIELSSNNWALSPFVKVWVFWAFFAPRPHMGNNGRIDQKPPQNCWFMSWSSPPTHSSKSCFRNYQGDPPHPP